MARKKVSLADALRKVLKANRPDRADKALEPWNDAELTLEDAEGLIAVLAEQPNGAQLIAESGSESFLYHFACLFQNDASEDATRALRARGVPELERLFDAALVVAGADAHPLLMCCKMFALYARAEAVPRIAAAVRAFPDEYMWEVVFGLFGEEQHPHSVALADALRDPLPTDFAAVAYLDLCNTLARADRLKKHPFDTAAGREKLEAWLADSDPDHFSYAVSAAAALPFVGTKARDALAALAMDHAEPQVQMEAAWASAYRGGTAGLKFLARACEDPRTAGRAVAYLEELGKADRVPASAREPNFEAMALMCNWLGHPQEFGAPPTEIELFDTRELDWYPTNDTRRVWLFKYTYAGREDDGSDTTGIGMVGSITFALFGESTPDLSAEDVYGLHCCWELEVNNDARAPKRRTAKAGRKLLGI